MGDSGREHLDFSRKKYFINFKILDFQIFSASTNILNFCYIIFYVIIYAYIIFIIFNYIVLYLYYIIFKVCRGPGPAPAFFLRPGPGGAKAPEKLLGPGPGGAMAPAYFFGPGPGIFSWPRPRAPGVVFGLGPGGHRPGDNEIIATETN